MCQHLLLRRSDFEGVNVEDADFTDVLLAWIELFSSYKHRILPQTGDTNNRISCPNQFILVRVL